MRHLATLLLALLLSMSCTAVPSQTDVPATEADDGTPPVETSELTAVLSATPTATVVPPTMTATVTSSPTPSAAAPTATPMASATVTPTPSPAMVSYTLQVSYALDGVTPDDPDAGPPEGEKWIVVVAAVQNDSAEPLVIERQSLTLIDQQGRRYEPDEPDEETQPPLVGARLEAGEDLLGLARFKTPEDAQATTLEWCPREESPCAQPLTSPIP